MQYEMGTTKKTEVFKNKGGRPPKLTRELIDKICNGVRLGFTFKDAAMFAGVPERTFYDWKVQAEREGASPLFKSFLHELKLAMVQGEAVLLKRIHDASSGGQTVTETRTLRDKKGDIIEETVATKTTPPLWTAAAWILERRHPDKWGRHIQSPAATEDDPLDKWLNDLNKAAHEYGDG